MKPILRQIFIYVFITIIICGSVVFLAYLRDENEPLQTISFENTSTLNRIDLNMISTNVNIVKSETTDITIELKKVNKYICIFENDNLIIKEKWKLINLFTNNTVTIAIPDGLYDYNIEMNNGNLTLESLSNYNELLIESKKGSINLANATCKGKCNINTTKGTVNVNEMIFNDLVQLNTTKGSVYFEKVELNQNIEISSKTGSAIFNDVSAVNIKIENKNGEIRLNLIGNKIKKIYTKTFAGLTEINLPKEKRGYRLYITRWNIISEERTYYSNVLVEIITGNGEIIFNKEIKKFHGK